MKQNYDDNNNNNNKNGIYDKHEISQKLVYSNLHIDTEIDYSLMEHFAIQPHSNLCELFESMQSFQMNVDL